MIVQQWSGPDGGIHVITACDICGLKSNKRGTQANRALAKSEHLCRAHYRKVHPFKMTDEMKKEVSRRTKTAMTPEIIAKMKANMPDTSGANNAFFGKKHSDETRRKISENNPYKGKCNLWWKPWMLERRKHWGAVIRRMFNNTCAMCNNTLEQCKALGIKLDAHHIVPVANDESLRYELSNGVALCRPCHAKCHALLKNNADEYKICIETLLTKREAKKAEKKR